ncbi:MAG: carbon-nitrogen hydrolase [Planctomycetota bacterium]
MAEQEPSDVVRIALIQARAVEDPDENLGRTVASIEQAAAKGARIVCTQELFRTRYFCQEEDARHFALAEPMPGETTEYLSDVARRLGIVLIASLFERRAPGLFHDTAIVLLPDGSEGGTYRKMHVPDDPRFHEKFYFTPGDRGFPVVETPFGRVGVLICWDQWFPEAARLEALAGAEILFYPTAIGTWTGERERQASQHAAWQTVQRGHAIANGVFVAAANRTGREDDIGFWGRSFVCRPDGSLAAEAGDEETVLLADVDPGAIGRAREGWPFLRDRRVDAYGGLTQRFLD